MAQKGVCSLVELWVDPVKRNDSDETSDRATRGEGLEHIMLIWP
jgi:hypothetical protein